mgnify:CR=1 FL=1
MVYQMNKSKIFIVLSSLLMVFGLTAGQTASARGFSGGHSFGGTHSVTHSYGGTHTTSPTRSFHTYRSTTKPATTYHAPSKSYSSVTRKSTPSSTTGSTKTYRVNRNNSASHNTYNSYNSYGNNRREGLGTMFGHSIVRGAGWSIGSNMGNSIWHQTFGFGGNQYYDNNGQVQYARAGFGGWFVLLFFITIIALIIFLIRKVLNNSGTDRHHY